MASNAWIFAGLASSFPNILPDSIQSMISKDPKRMLSNSTDSEPGTELPPPPCKIIQCSQDETTEVTAEEAQDHLGLKPQVLIFRYRDKFHAVDHACPHRTYPLSRGSIYDIEDFGIILSAGITCPGHGWAFDLFTGESDRGKYRLALWDVEVRNGETEGEDEIWVRKRGDQTKKRRIG